MSKGIPKTESILDLIYEETLRKLAAAELFDKDALNKLESLAAVGELKDWGKVTAAIESESGDSDEDTEA